MSLCTKCSTTLTGTELVCPFCRTVVPAQFHASSRYLPSYSSVAENPPEDVQQHPPALPSAGTHPILFAYRADGLLALRFVMRALRTVVLLGIMLALVYVAVTYRKALGVQSTYDHLAAFARPYTMRVAELIHPNSMPTQHAQATHHHMSRAAQKKVKRRLRVIMVKTYLPLPSSLTGRNKRDPAIVIIGPKDKPTVISGRWSLAPGQWSKGSTR